MSFLHSFTPRSFCLAYVTLVCTSSGRKTRRRTRSTPADDMYGTLATALLTIARASSRPTSTVSFRHGPPTLTPNTGRHLDAHEDAGDTTRSSSSLDNSRTRRRECAGASGGASTSTENSRNMTAAPLSPPVPVPRRCVKHRQAHRACSSGRQRSVVMQQGPATGRQRTRGGRS